MFTNRKRTDLLVDVGTFRNVTFYTTDPSTTLTSHNVNHISYTIIFLGQTVQFRYAELRLPRLPIIIETISGERASLKTTFALHLLDCLCRL